jgi:hypothetical protein
VIVLFCPIETEPVAVTTSSQPPETTTVLLGPTLKVPVLMAQGVALSAHCTARKGSVREEQLSICGGGEQYRGVTRTMCPAVAWPEMSETSHTCSTVLGVK